MEITADAKRRAIRALELSLTCQDTAEEVVTAVIDALNYSPSKEVQHAAAVLRRWNIGDAISSEADFEEIVEVVLRAAGGIRSPQQAVELLIRALSGIRNLLKWVASRSNLDVTRDDAAQATIWVNIIQKLQIVHGFNQDMEWHPHHTELLRLMSVTSGIRSGTLVEMEGEHDD